MKWESLARVISVDFSIVLQEHVTRCYYWFCSTRFLVLMLDYSFLIIAMWTWAVKEWLREIPFSHNQFSDLKPHYSTIGKRPTKKKKRRGKGFASNYTKTNIRPLIYLWFFFGNWNCAVPHSIVLKPKQGENHRSATTLTKMCSSSSSTLDFFVVIIFRSQSLSQFLLALHYYFDPAIKSR